MGKESCNQWKWQKKLVGVLLLVGIVIGTGIGLWIHTSYPLDESAVDALLSSTEVSVVEEGNFITFIPTDKDESQGIIFYPGAKVEAEAYAPLAKSLAEEGYTVALVRMPLNFAMLGMDRGEEVLRAYPHLEEWAIAGHSLGGVAATGFADGHESIKKVILLASYPMNDALRMQEKEVLSLWGTEDGVLNFKSLEASKGDLPEDTVYTPIVGGNHAQFGTYGEQSGDNKALITEEEQRHKTVEAIRDFLG